MAYNFIMFHKKNIFLRDVLKITSFHFKSLYVKSDVLEIKIWNALNDIYTHTHALELYTITMFFVLFFFLIMNGLPMVFKISVKFM
jgi:hypothetical protein